MGAETASLPPRSPRGRATANVRNGSKADMRGGAQSPALAP